MSRVTEEIRKTIRARLPAGRVINFAVTSYGHSYVVRYQIDSHMRDRWERRIAVFDYGMTMTFDHFVEWADLGV